MQMQALSAMVAWVRLDQAIQSFNQMLRREYGITGLQLAVLRILGERPQLPLAALMVLYTLFGLWLLSTPNAG